MANKKAIIIGASTTGKTTLTQYIRKHTSLPVSESDEILTRLNAGTYPFDTNLKMNILAPRMVNEILNKDKIIFFSNTHYFSKKDIIKAKKKGFVILQLSLEKEKMLVRSEYRRKEEGYEDHSKYFNDMLTYQAEILESGLVDAVIDTDKTVEKLAEEILLNLNSK